MWNEKLKMLLEYLELTYLKLTLAATSSHIHVLDKLADH